MNLMYECGKKEYMTFKMKHMKNMDEDIKRLKTGETK